MAVSLLLILLGMAVGLSLIDRAEPAQQLPLIHASCTTVHRGPVRRPDGYTTHPYGRKPDVA